MKRCTACKVEKPAEAFYLTLNRQGRYVARPTCIICTQRANLARYWHDPEPKRAAARAWWQTKGAHVRKQFATDLGQESK